LETLKMLASERVRIVVIIDLLHKSGTLRAVLPDRSEFIGGPWHSVLETIPHNTFQGTGHRGKEICSRLSVRAIEANIDKVVLRVGTPAEVNLTALVEDKDFVKDLQLLVTGSTPDIEMLTS